MTAPAAAPSPPLRVVSYGGGVQSTALLVLAASGLIDFPVFLMANVGDDSEHPATLRYVREIAMPYAAAHGIDVRLLDRVKRDGTTETLWARLMREGRSLPIPVRMSNGAPGTRSCTADFKIRVIGKWLREGGATGGTRCKPHKLADGDTDSGPRPDCAKCVLPNVATVGIGISVDEIHRANNRRVSEYEQVVYPLLDLGLRRDDCARIIRDAGLPVPPKSSCFFCPFHSENAWFRLRDEAPELFDKSCELEDTLNERRDVLGKDHVYLTRFGRPLRDVIPDGVETLPLADDSAGLDVCESGWCMT